VLQKTCRYTNACKTHEGLRAAWDAGIGPGQKTPEEKRRAARQRLKKICPQPDQAKWPIWAKQLLIWRRDEDVGLGDTAEHAANALGGKLYKRLTKALGMPCKCDRRKVDWNYRYPYVAKESV
jgi:hypothetical protein